MRGRRPALGHRTTVDQFEDRLGHNEKRKETRLTLPVLAIGGARYCGPQVAETMRPAADDVSEVVIDDCGHYVAEEQPARFTEVLEDFLGSNR